MTPRCLRLLPALLTATVMLPPSLSAQRVLVPDTDQQLQLFDLRDLIRDGSPGVELMLKGDRSPFDATASERAARMLRQFVDPPLRKGDDLTAIGEHRIAVFADAERIASVERILTAAKKHQKDLLTIEVQLLDVPAGKFRKYLREHLTKVEAKGDGASTFQSVFGKEAAKLFLATCDKIDGAGKLAAPLVSVLPLQQAEVSVVNQTSYVKDFTVQRSDANEVVADPVVDVVWSGHRAEVCATFLPHGRIGLSCDLRFQELQRPIPEVKVNVLEGALPVTIQIPRTSGVRLANVAEVTPGSVVALAAQRLDGNFLVALIQANAVGNR
ncbi:MAG: hypothetical protein ACE37K_25745 [Planctomycetota bacterium]